MDVNHGQSWTGLRGKTLWDWLQLLIVPAVLSVAALWFSAAAEDRARQIEEARVMDGVLQSYLDQISALLLDRNLLGAERAEVRDLARARTLTALGQLDGRRKGFLVGFLYETGLIKGSRPIIRLGGAVLGGHNPDEVVLSQADLSGAKLARIFLIEANLTRVRLAGADLRNSILDDMDLNASDLRDADLSGARLDGTALNGANLAGANLTGTELAGATLVGADLTGADLTGARLNGARLVVAKTMRGQPQGLVQSQLDAACGDAQTQLPQGYTIPTCPASHQRHPRNRR